MIKKLDQCWRIFATALSFLAFGLGGLLLRLAVFPLLKLAVGNQHAQEVKLARLIVHITFKAFINLMQGLGVLRYRINGLEKLDRPGLLILANHPSLIDVVFLIAMIRNADCVVKASLARNPFTRGPVRATNYICNDSGAPLVDACIASLREGSNLVMFPEGTRTPVSGIMKLQRGAANIAVRGRHDITPVTIHCVPLSLAKDMPWWKVPPQRIQFTIDIQDDIAVRPFIEQAEGEMAVAARQLTHHLHHYFSTENTHHAGA
ncbi:lysophospholipid acyltransferase family protein [Undibacterium sp. TJN25]|uniref:lysophospholipid acyltransferase family protein n=1 Tax=Undibacterium sp. TJN25 TaxID=3413056 RepID=UPI003BF0F990